MKPRSLLFLLTLTFSLALEARQHSTKNPMIGQILDEISAENLRRTVEALVGFGSRHTLSDTVSTSAGIGAARRWIKSEFERYAASSKERMTVAFHESMAQPSQRIPRPTKIINVVATLRPSTLDSQTSSRVFIVCGHYDSRASNAMDSTGTAPGANDDGSGTALVMELARVFSKYEFEATITFVAFAGEEQGLLGSAALASSAKEERWNIQGVFNNDIVGSSHGGNGEVERSYVRLFSEAYGATDTGGVFRRRNSLGLENDGSSRSLARYIKEAADLYLSNFSVKLVYRRDRFLRGGDHTSFNEHGFPAVRFTEANENFDRQHQNVRTEEGRSYGDLPEFMDFEYCANVARVNAAALASLALAPQAPEEAQVATRNLEYTTTLQWRRNQEPDIAGYYVRYRETTSPMWQYSVFTQDTSHTLQVSKDDFLFGVQSVDTYGNVSPVAIPRASR